MLKIILSFIFVLLISTCANADTNWNAVEKLTQNKQPLTIATLKGKTTYTQGEKLILGVKVDNPGYLNVVSIDANDKVTVLFPNKYHPNNQVLAADVITLPTRKMKFDLTAQAPFGKTLIVAFLSDSKLNLYQSQTKSLEFSNDAKAADFKQLSNKEVVSFSKGFEPTEKKNESVAESKAKANSKIKAGKLELMVCEIAESC
jgi:hypothetical protein